MCLCVVVCLCVCVCVCKCECVRACVFVYIRSVIFCLSPPTHTFMSYILMLIYRISDIIKSTDHISILLVYSLNTYWTEGEARLPPTTNNPLKGTKHHHLALPTWHPHLGRSGNTQGTPLLETKLVAHVKIVAVGEGEAVTHRRILGRLRVVVALAFVDVKGDVTLQSDVPLVALLRVSEEGGVVICRVL